MWFAVQEKPLKASKKKAVIDPDLNPEFSFEEEHDKIASWIPQ